MPGMFDECDSWRYLRSDSSACPMFFVLDGDGDVVQCVRAEKGC